MTPETAEERAARIASWLSTGEYGRFSTAAEFQTELDKHVPTGDVLWLCQAAIIRIGNLEDEVERWRGSAEQFRTILRSLCRGGDTP